MRPWRIAVGVALLLLAVLIGFSFVADRQREPDLRQVANASPVMDLADPGTRRVVSWLMQGEANHFGGQWLGESCGYGDTDQRLVLSREVPAEVNRRAIYLRMNDGGGNAYYSARPLTPGEPAYGRAWLLQARDVARIRQLLDKGGYYSLPPAGVEGFCHTEITSLETCVDGRYYGVMRMCEGLDEVPQQALRNIAQSLEKMLDEISIGETGRQAAAATEGFKDLQRPASM